MICKGKNCTNSVQAKGCCTTHLSRLNNGREFDAPIQKQVRRVSDTCSIESCDREYYCKSYCHLHYKRSVSGVELTKKYYGYRRGKLEKTCPHCTLNFYVKKSEPARLYCSRKCSQSSKKGASNQNWKGGLTEGNMSERNRFSREVRELVFARDNYTCQVCQTEASGDLQVDHLKRWSEYPELRFALDNCRTLCRACHYFVTLKRKMPQGSMWGVKFNLSKGEQ